MNDLQLETAPVEAPAALSYNRSIEETRDSATVPAKVRKKRFGMRRLIVLLAVGLATIAAALTGASWLLYRVGHTVISNATVKGRLHRIGARIDCQVKSIDVQPSQRVSKGDVLIRLQDEHFQAALREAQSELNSALKRYEAEKLAVEQERRLRPLEVDRCENVRKAAAGELEAASMNFGKLEREFRRTSMLIKSGISSTSEVDRAQADRDNARALVSAAEAKLAAADSSCRVATVQVDLRAREAGLDVLAAEIERARQHLSAAEADLSATVIHAPEDGWVAERVVEPGGSAKVGEPILTLWLGKPWIEAWVDEKRLSRVGIGKPVDVTLAAFVGRKLSGRVDAIGVLSDRELQATGSVPSTLHSLFPADAMVPVRITVDSGELRLQPGLSAIVGIHSPESSEWLSRIGLALNFTNAMKLITKGN